MPKNTTVGARSKMRSKSTRKPLREISNAKGAVKPPDNFEKKTEDDGGQMGDDSLDRILLVQSDLSSLVRQIDELVVQALQLTDSKGNKEIKQFADVLSDMQTSLKPWVPRLHEALSSRSKGPYSKSEQPKEANVPCVTDKNKSAIIESPVQTKWDSLVSPSPLVSWRAECKTDGGRQLFLLTPLPQKRAFLSKCPASPMLMFENLKNDKNKTHPKCGTPEKFSEMNCPVLAMTPRLKMSPPKSCILLEPISEFNNKKGLRAHKSTPFPTRVQNSSDSEDSESSSSQSSDELAMKYPELYGIRINNLEKRTVEEESPDWVVSPPMTCAIMEPADEKLMKNMSGNRLVPKTAAITKQGDGLSVVKEIECEDDHGIAAKTHMQSIRGAIDFTESTPMMKERMSSFRMGKQPGENTLKKELWTRFEAASSHIIGLDDDPILEDSNHAFHKGFLDRLDEVIDS